MNKKAVILLGGTGSRLKPMTSNLSKQLLPISGKPIFYYPLSICMLVKIKDILFIVTQPDYNYYVEFSKYAKKLGINIEIVIQDKPTGLAHALLLAKEFVGNDKFLFLLGDNIVVGHSITDKINAAFEDNNNHLFTYFVDEPSQFGVVESDFKDFVTNIIEKPTKFVSNWAVIGIYVFNQEIFSYAEKVELSPRGEYEIEDAIHSMITTKIPYKNNKLGRGFTWFDVGTMSNFMLANNFIFSHEKTSQKGIAYIEEISLNNSWISTDELTKMIEHEKSEYYNYLKKEIKNGHKRNATKRC